MSKLYIKPYGAFVLTSNDFPEIEEQVVRRLVFTPDNLHSVSVAFLRDGTLLITNENKIPFEISISRNQEVMTVLKYQPEFEQVLINSIWRLTKNGVDSREGSETPDLIFSPNLNVDLRGDGIGRIDVKVDKSGFACCLFSSKELLFVRMNGHHVVPRFTEFINDEARKLQPTIGELLDANPGIRKQIGEKFFEEWTKTHEWGLN